MKRISVLVVAVLAFSFPGAALAQEPEVRLLGALTKRTSSVLKVMKRAGCHSSWLDKVVADSGLSDRNLRRLDPGTKVYIKGSCNLSAPQLAARVATLDASVKKFEIEKVDLVAKLEALEAALQAMALENAALKAVEKSAFDYQGIAAAGLIGASAGLALAYTLFIRRTRGTIAYPQKVKVKEEGETFVFSLHEVSEKQRGSGVLVGKYQCSACPVKNIFGDGTKNFHQHLRNSCTRPRVSVSVDPALA